MEISYLFLDFCFFVDRVIIFSNKIKIYIYENPKGIIKYEEISEDEKQMSYEKIKLSTDNDIALKKLKKL